MSLLSVEPNRRMGATTDPRCTREKTSHFHFVCQGFQPPLYLYNNKCVGYFPLSEMRHLTDSASIV